MDGFSKIQNAVHDGFGIPWGIFHGLVNQSAYEFTFTDALMSGGLRQFFGLLGFKSNGQHGIFTVFIGVCAIVIPRSSLYYKM